MSTDLLLLDLQGFRDYKNRFIIKELAYATKEYTQVYLVKPPYPFSKLTNDEKKQVKWLERNRGIYWRQGYIDYNEFSRLIKPVLDKANVFVKGSEKCKWLRELSPDCKVLDIGERGCPNLKSLFDSYQGNDKICCFNHQKYCALKTVICLRKWYYNDY